MITTSDSFFTYDLGQYYVILPSQPNFDVNKYVDKHRAQKVSQGFSYNSKDNDKFLSVSQLRNLMKKHLKFDL